ncbi:MAG: hypothetical protein IJ423_05665 [Clostridia bacterium]|nr:hypothetical protein [Clostridia bacterium]MBQ8637458.1 hypothetical protein [Clostridia bacterium]
MAKKNENKLSYLQMPLPESKKHYKMKKRSWSGLNYRQTIDTGALSMENNISTLEAPYLVPSQRRISILDDYTRPIGMFGFDDFLIVIYRNGTSIYVDYITYDADEDEYTTYTGTLQNGGASTDDEYPRCVVQFNVYDTPTDPVSGKYVKKLLIFPDKKSMDFEITEDGFTISDMSVLVKEFTPTGDKNTPPDTASHNYYYRNTKTSDVYKWVDDMSDSENSGWKVSVPPAMPNIKYAAVHLSRLFGVDDDRVYASGYNDYTNWNLDTIDEYNESNAWCSPAQSNTKAGGVFTGITNFQGHIVCFKRDFMHEIYNTKNPFRIQDIYAEGAIDHRTIQDVDGRLIFVSEDDVKIYTGSNPRIIGYYLNMPEYVNAVSGTDGRCYYLYCEDADGNKRLFVYDTIAENWSEQTIYDTVLSFAHNKHGMYMLCDDGYIYKMDTGNYRHSWSFETDLITNETVNIKHIKKIQMFADIASGANIKAYILYDDEEFDEDTSHLVYSSTGYGQKPIRVKPRQTASYGIKLHIEGYGYVKLYELELFMENGGDLYV